MESLPPKPEALVKERDDRRFGTDSRQSSRPVVSQRYHGDSYSDRDRPYFPRQRVDHDTYIPNNRDGRRDDELRRTDRDSSYDRSRDWDRMRGRNREYDRDRDREWRGRERDRDRSYRADRDNRSREHGSEYRNWDRDRSDRWKDDERSTDRQRDSRLYSPPPRHNDFVNRHSSLSPRSRRPHSPVSSYRGRQRSRTRSPAPPTSPPLKRIKLGNHSISGSPRSRSPSHVPPQNAEPLSVQTYKPEDNVSPEATSGNLISGKLDTFTSGSLLTDSSAHKKGQDDRSPTAPATLGQRIELSKQLSYDINKEYAKSADARTSAEHMTWEETKRDPKEEHRDVRIDTHDRPPLSPKRPNMEDIPSKSDILQRRESRSPPRGPRNTQRIPLAPHYPTGPRNNRRIQPPITTPSNGLASPHEQTPAAAPATESDIQLPPIPEYKRKVVITELDLEVARHKAHREHLVTGYRELETMTRRALHELDLAMIDLRAAEERRVLAAKFARSDHGQLEKEDDKKFPIS